MLTDLCLCGATLLFQSFIQVIQFPLELHSSAVCLFERRLETNSAGILDTFKISNCVVLILHVSKEYDSHLSTSFELNLRFTFSFLRRGLLQTGVSAEERGSRYTVKPDTLLPRFTYGYTATPTPPPPIHNGRHINQCTTQTSRLRTISYKQT